MQIGNVLLAWRRSLGLSQQKAAKVIGIDDVNLHRLEHGGEPSARTLLALLAWLFGMRRGGER